MAVINGLASGVAWTGFTGLFASPGYASPYKFDLNIAGGSVESTGYGGSAVIASTHLPTPASWTGTITCRAPNTVQTGYAGLVSFSGSEYTSNIKDWALTLAYASKEVTAFNGTGVSWKEFVALAASWSGTFSGFVDGTTPVTPPTLPGATLSTITCKLIDQGASADDTLSGAAMVTQTGPSAGLDGSNEASLSFQGSGVLTAAGVNYGTNSSGVFDDTAGTIVTPSAGSLVLTAASGRTYTGDAFPTSLAWRCGVATALELVIGVQGTGALTIA